MIKNNKKQYIFFILLVLVTFACANSDKMLIDCAFKNDIECVKKAIKGGANVNIRINEGEYKGYTLLMWASKNGKTDLVKNLLKAGADVNLKKVPFDKKSFSIYNGWTALQFASLKHLEIVKLLIKAGAEVNSRDNNEYTILSTALQYTEHKNFDIALELIKSGANINSNKGLPLGVVSTRGDIIWVKLFIKYGANVKKYGHFAIIGATLDNKRLDIVKLLIENGADVNGGDEFGSMTNPGPVIIRVVENGDLDIVQINIIKYLVQKGANVNAVRDGYRTLLMVAVEKRNIELIKFFIEKGANVNKTDPNGATVLDYINISTDNNKKAEIIQILKAAGARRGSGQPYRMSR